jgi:hypothetical protein
MKKKIVVIISILIIATLLLCGCGEKKTVSGKITNLRYYGVGLDNACELTFDDGSKYPIVSSSITKYGLQEGMNVTLDLEFMSSLYEIKNCVIEG